MQKHILIALLFPFYTFSQNKNSSIELASAVRYDRYADFDDRYDNRSYTTRLNLKGISWGVNVKYRFSIGDKWNAKAGIGFYKYSFNSITNFNPLVGATSNGREVNIVRANYPLYITDNYWYNCINLNFQVERVFPVNTKYDVALGAEIDNFISYSQHYNVPGDHSIEKINSFHYFAFSNNISLGLNKKLRTFYIGGNIILPVFDTWSNDKKLSQTSIDSRKKWINGIGINFTIGYYLKNKL